MEGITGESERTVGAVELKGAVMALCRLSQIVNSRYSRGEALSLATDTVAALTSADKVAVLTTDGQDMSLRLAAAYGLPKSAFHDSHPVGEELTRRCLRALAPILIPDTSADEHSGSMYFADQGISSVLCVPLCVGEEAFGAVLAMTVAPHSFTAAEIEIIHTIAGQASLAIWKSDMLSATPPQLAEEVASAGGGADLIQLANRKIENLSIVNRVSQAVISTLDMDKILNIVLDESLAAVGGGAGSLMLVGEDGLLRIVVSRGLPKNVVENVRVRLGEGIAGRIAQQGKPALISKGKERGFAEVALRPDITSSMCVPLYTGVEVIGVLNISTVAPAREFGERDLELLSTMANQMAMAINNARLHDNLQKQASELAALLEIAHTVTATLELDEVLQRVTKEISRLVEVDVCVAVLFDEISGRLRFGAGHGLSTVRKRRGLKWSYMDLASPCAAEAVNTRQVSVRDDIQAENCPYSAAIARNEGLNSALCVPLQAKERIVGAVAAFSRRQRPFSHEEIEFLTALGELAGIAIHNARIYKHKYDIANLTRKDLTPKVDLQADGLDIGHKFFAVREVGGDYYDFITVAPGKIGIVMADVAGSSVAAAAYTSMARSVLRAYARENDSPSQVLAKLNNLVREDSAPEIFVSLFYGVLDLKTKELTYCLAGHEPPLLYRASTCGFRLLRADGILIGILPDANFEEKKVRLRSGDMVAIFTDGLTDAAVKRKRFGLEAVKQVIAADALKPAQEVADNIYGRLLSFASNRIQDDVALLVLKVR